MVFLIVFVTFQVCLNTVLAVDPKLKITESDPSVSHGKVMMAKRGQDVTISCYVENLPKGTEVRWQRTYLDNNGKEQTQPIATNQGVVDNTRYGIEKPTMFTWRLRIRAIPVSFTGTYTCYVQVVLQIKAYVERDVLVYIPPTLILSQTSSDMTVREGDEVDLICNATGLPTPTIEWSRQGKALLPIGKEIHLGEKMTIVSINYHHRGVYRCEAYNIIGKVIRNIEVDVKFKPIVIPVNRVIKQAKGYVSELQCIVEANPDPSSGELVWYRGATSISQSSGRFIVKTIRGAFNRLTYELTINGVTSDDFGNYRCQATNNLGRTSAELTLEETDTPQKSIKLGIIIKGAATSVSSCVFTLFITVAVILIQHL